MWQYLLIAQLLTPPSVAMAKQEQQDQEQVNFVSLRSSVTMNPFASSFPFPLSPFPSFFSPFLFLSFLPPFLLSSPLSFLDFVIAFLLLMYARLCAQIVRSR